MTRKFGLISSARKCLPCQHFPAWSWNRETAAERKICTGLTMIATEQCK